MPASNNSVRAVIITGSGSKAFVAGADIGEIHALSPLQAREFSELGQQLMRQIEHCGKPVLAAINGFALGGGMELALACHLRIASDNAKLGLPEISLGIMPGFGGTQRLVRMLGRSRAMHMILSGKPIDAASAESMACWRMSIRLRNCRSRPGVWRNRWRSQLRLPCAASWMPCKTVRTWPWKQL